ncbi:unnamed protein product [Camellia sinensis]
MGGGTWDRDTVVRALRAAYNPERAVEYYLYLISFVNLFFKWEVQKHDENFCF